MYEIEKINVREIFGHNRIAKINVRKLSKTRKFRQKNLGGKNFSEIFKNHDFILQNKAIFMFLENFFRFPPIFEKFLDFGGFNFGEIFGN